MLPFICKGTLIKALKSLLYHTTVQPALRHGAILVVVPEA